MRSAAVRSLSTLSVPPQRAELVETRLTNGALLALRTAGNQTGDIQRHLRTVDGRALLFVKKLERCLMGNAIQAVECSTTHSGEPQAREPYHFVVVKHLFKWCLEFGLTRELQTVLEDPIAEVNVLLSLEPGHQNVNRLVALYDDDHSLYIVLEYCDGGDLQQVISKSPGGRLAEADARAIMWQLLQGTRYLHANGIAHCDLSLENSMLATRALQRNGEDRSLGEISSASARSNSSSAVGGTGNGPLPSAAQHCDCAKIIDFGLAQRLPPAGRLLPAGGRRGKATYMPPEIFYGAAYDPTKSDAWCLGACLYIMLFGAYPYSSVGDKYYDRIARGGLASLLGEWGWASWVSHPALDLVCRMLVVEPQRRISVSDALRHGWFSPMGEAGGFSAGLSSTEA